MSVLALDIGDIRVGVAISRGTLAAPLGWFDKRRGAAERQIKELIRQEKVEKIVVGIPLNADNTVGPQAQKCIQFARRLQRRIEATFVFVDEYASTCEAAALEGVTPVAEKGVLDARTASILLQSFLDGRAVSVAATVLEENKSEST